jgi:prevent-host-death family protein
MCNDVPMNDDALLKRVASSDARNHFKQVLKDIHHDVHIVITHYGEDVAVVVPDKWYEEALDLMAHYGGAGTE